MQFYQATVDLFVAACKQNLKMHLLDAESAEFDAVDHPSLHGTLVSLNENSSICIML